VNLRQPLVTFACAACYGFALGAAHDDLYAARNMIKFPLLISATATICSLSWWVLSQTLGARLGFLAVQRAAWMLFHDVSILLASLSPAVLFVALVMRRTDDGLLGEYDFYLKANVMLIGACGVLALWNQARALMPNAGISMKRAIPVVLAWLAVTCFVGGQVAFLLRPYFGFPATRGGTPPWFLWDEADVRGATNFYEAIWQAIERKALPEFGGYR
jgi:hypothetical protein